MPAQLVIKPVQSPAGTNVAAFPVNIDMSATVAELKEQVAAQVGIPKEHIRLVCAGRIWLDTSTVGSYEPSDGAMVHCLNNPPKAAAAAGIAAEQTLQPANPMAQMMGGMPSLGAASTGDPMQQMMAQSQAMMAQNPEMMQQMMQSPMVQQMMSDPETMRAMIRMNPQLNQLMETRPEIARLLEDPDVLRQSMQMMANPSLMREMTRNNDRAIGRLDVMPGGHSALAQAHQDFADPLYEALSGSGGAAIQENLAHYASQTEGLPNNDALPNPWGAPAPSPTTATTAAAPAAAPQQFAHGMPGMPAANPMAAMMQQMMNPQAAAATPPPMNFGAQAGANPMAAMMQQMTNSQAPAVASPPMGTPQVGANPMAAMMQQMMQNPAMMQQSMQMAQQMFGSGAGVGGMQQSVPGAATNPTSGQIELASNPTANLLPASPMMPNPMMAGANPYAANPYAAMMQQMMGNPSMSQQQQAMAQQFSGGYPGFGMGMPPVAPAGETPIANASTVNAPADNAMTLAANRARFAAQLAQLTTMGFTNETLCLQALAQHNGRIDAAIDTLLS